MHHDDTFARQPAQGEAGRLTRRTLLSQLCALGGMAAAGLPMASAWAAGEPGRGRGELLVRWLGGGVVEIATPDYKQIAYCDAWVWNNSGWDRFGLAKPPEYASRAGFIQYLTGKNPDAIFVLLTHDHGDHMGDYLEMLKAIDRKSVV